tara:strand:- start:2559 stop:2723 length:165 start_codon:yes stop_codon:yes gene_type:complete
VKKGDLVKDKDITYSTQYGVIIEEDKDEGMFKVIWNGGGKEWLTEMYLEVIPRS